MDQNELKRAYINYVTKHGKTPTWPYEFTDPLKLEPGSFYDLYPSLAQIEQDIWSHLFASVVNRLEDEPAYLEYSAREKLLAFYFTLIEAMSEKRDFITILVQRLRLSVTPAFLKLFKRQYLNYVGELIRQAKMEKEALDRPIIDTFYDSGLWWQCQFIIWFWVRDQSESNELTDAAIERAVHLSFDLMGPTPIDSVVAFAKFLYQSR